MARHERLSVGDLTVRAVGGAESVSAATATATTFAATSGQKITFAAAAPTTGANTRGSIVFNTAPSAEGYVGWVCTAAGTPGTWKTFGEISA
jgi:hypothetical protein